MTVISSFGKLHVVWNLCGFEKYTIGDEPSTVQQIVTIYIEVCVWNEYKVDIKNVFAWMDRVHVLNLFILTVNMFCEYRASILSEI